VVQGGKAGIADRYAGVLGTPGKLLRGLTPKQIDDLVEDGMFSGGMRPKIASALEAARTGVDCVQIIVAGSNIASSSRSSPIMPLAP
jgi:acetylglutamate kinase